MFVCVETECPSQQFFSRAVTEQTLVMSVRIARLVERCSSDTEDPDSNPSAAILFGCVLEQGTLQALLLSTQVYKRIPVRDVCQCTAAACGAMC